MPGEGNRHYDSSSSTFIFRMFSYFDTEQHATQVTRALGNILFNDFGMRDHLTD
jgi:hypothetical protein